MQIRLALGRLVHCRRFRFPIRLTGRGREVRRTRGGTDKPDYRVNDHQLVLALGLSCRLQALEARLEPVSYRGFIRR